MESNNDIFKSENNVKVLCAYTELRDIDLLVLNPRNNNVPPKAQIEQLAKIIKYTGFRSPVVVSNRSGFVVKGHGRIEASRLLGIKDIPIDCQDYEDEAQEWADMIADNKIASYAEFDELKTKELLEDLESLGLDLENTGFSQADADELLLNAELATISDEHEHDDSINNPDESKASTKAGDIIELGQHRLICGSSTEADTVIKLMQGKKASLFATDPPYLVAYNGNDWDNENTEANADLYNKFIDTAITHAILPNAAFYCWHASAKVGILIDAWKKHNVLNHNQIIWVKPSPTIGRSWYLWRHEPCLMGWIQGNKPSRESGEYLSTAWEKGTLPPEPLEETPPAQLGDATSYVVPSTVWHIATPTGNDRPDHPTPKPLECFAIPMRQHTKKGDIVYEPFCGSGSQLIAADKLSRICYAIELSPTYCDRIIQRYLDLNKNYTAIVNGKDQTQLHRLQMQAEEE